MRKVKYYSNKIIDLEEEKSFLNNAKAHKVLSALVKEDKNYSDRYMAMVTKMSVNTYQKWKSHLVMVGLLQIRQLNAMTYFISIGEDAIEKDDILNSISDDSKLLEATLISLGYDISECMLIDDPNNVESIPTNRDLLNGSERRKYNKIIRDNPMPDKL